VWLPMKILDDLSICEQRAVLRAETQLSAKPTQPQVSGKEWWSRRKHRYSNWIRLALSSKGLVHSVWVEHSVELAYEGLNTLINLSGLVDVIVLYSLNCGKDYIPVIVLFEFTLHREVSHIASRVVAYASAVYTKYGFATIPVAVVVKDTDEDLVERIMLLVNTNNLGVTPIDMELKHLERLLSRATKPRHAHRDVCVWCDTELRRRCVYYM